MGYLTVITLVVISLLQTVAVQTFTFDSDAGHDANLRAHGDTQFLVRAVYDDREGLLKTRTAKYE